MVIQCFHGGAARLEKRHGFAPRAPRDLNTENFNISELSVRNTTLLPFVGSAEGLNLHMERYLLIRFGKDVLLKTVF
jgi:hypothetical protein